MNKFGQYLAAFVVGILFAVGLGVAGMTLPRKVIGFLDFTGEWDPALAFVMGGAVLVYFVGYRLVTQRAARPRFAAKFSLPTRREITPRLVVGATLFGLGWGLGGFCPGPALASVGSGAPEVFAFIAAMMGGMYLHGVVDRALKRRATADESTNARESSRAERVTRPGSDAPVVSGR
jgi:uncharacterized membrane protein YedE/YeeE